jgi:apolipoprotein N-acyltransferase
LYYAKLRAIENRREILRSANTGISAHIDAFGNLTQITDWWVEDAIQTEFNLYEIKTVFTRTGDFVGRICSFIGVFLILGIFVKKRTQKNSSIF